MDLGAFRRNRTALLAWLLLPVMTIGTATYALHVYGGYVEESLSRRQAFMDIVPDVRRRLRVARDVVTGFGRGCGGARARIDVYQTRMHDMARRHGILVNSLRIESGGAHAGAGTSFDIHLRGEGVLIAVVRLLSEVHGPPALVAVRGVRLTLKRLADEPLYEVDLVLRCYGMEEGHD